jgi:hypothetical protein
LTGGLEITETENVENEPLQIIVGEKLSAVVFVMDYIQLQFDGPCLSLIHEPEVITPTGTYTRDVPGFRDTLCEQITHIVTSALVTMNDDFEIMFDHGTIIRISLRPEDQRFPEAVIFDPNDKKDKRLWVC